MLSLILPKNQLNDIITSTSITSTSPLAVLTQLQPLFNRHSLLLYFMVDGALIHKKGESFLDYAEREVGKTKCGLQSLCEVYAHLFENFNAPLTIALIEELYKIAIEYKNESEKHLEENKQIEQSFRSRPTSFLLEIGVDISEAGLRELLSAIKEYGEIYGIALVPTDEIPPQFDNWDHLSKVLQQSVQSDKAIRFDNVGKCDFQDVLSKVKNKKYHYIAPKATKIKELLGKAATAYNKILEVNNQPAINKLITILEFTAVMDRIHPFPDCNLRIAKAIEFWMLVKYGFLPQITYEPNRACHYTQEELLKEYLADCNTTQTFCEKLRHGGTFDRIEYKFTEARNYNESQENILYCYNDHASYIDLRKCYNITDIRDTLKIPQKISKIFTDTMQNTFDIFAKKSCNYLLTKTSYAFFFTSEHKYLFELIAKKDISKDSIKILNEFSDHLNKLFSDAQLSINRGICYLEQCSREHLNGLDNIMTIPENLKIKLSIYIILNRYQKILQFCIKYLPNLNNQQKLSVLLQRIENFILQYNKNSKNTEQKKEFCGKM